MQQILRVFKIAEHSPFTIHHSLPPPCRPFSPSPGINFLSGNVKITMKEMNVYYIRYPFLAAILYNISLVVFLFNTRYENVWVLYIGNILFCATVLWALIHFNHKVRDIASIKSMFMVGLKITLYGVIIASILCFILLGIKYYVFNAH